MKLTKVTLCPFGGLASTQLELEDGINVIQGPNEAGKSTIFNAIQKALFTPSKLKKREFEREIRRWLPVGGGDTVKVELEFEEQGEKYTLKKMWGNSASSELILPNGGLLTNEDTINETLAPMLKAGEGTYRSVLMTYQSGLAKTLEDIKNDEKTVYDLGEIVRKSMLETDGVSIEKFRTVLEELQKDYLSRWDIKMDCPEDKKRSFNNPFKRGVGKVLQAYYDKEEARYELEQTLAFEDQLDRINKDISDLNNDIRDFQDYLDENAPVVDGIKERQTLESEQKVLTLEINELNSIATDWPIVEKTINDLEKELTDLNEKLTAALEEEKLATAWQDQQDLVRKFTRVEEKKKTLDAVQKDLDSIRKLTTEDLDKLREAHTRLDVLKARLDAGKLDIRFEALKDLDITISKDLEPPANQTLSKNETTHLQAGAKLRIDHPDWALEVTSPEVDMEEYDTATKQKDDLLTSLKVTSLEDAITLNKTYQTHLNNVTSARSNLEQELDKDTYEDLAQKVGALAPTAPTRDLPTIIEDRTNLRNKLDSHQEKREQATRTLQKYTTDHDTKEALTSTLTTKIAQNTILQTNLDSLAPLPEDIKDTEAFLQAFQSKKQTLESKKDRTNDLLIERASLHPPEYSSEELKVILADYEKTFQTLQKKARALEKVLQTTTTLSQSLDEDTYAPLQKDLESYISLITRARYTRVEMDDSLPEGLLRSDGNVLPYNYLSAGTKDMLSLALRLTLAGHFLEDGGFLVMDDPFVDMDPERQEGAALLLKKVAEDRQVLLFTCHPGHGELVGGKVWEV